jgi:ABC-2 type transport system ATP-binding protein
MSPTARLIGITRTFRDVTAIADLDLELQPGTLYGLLGPNGAGKTTTLRTLIGLQLPDRGTVELLGGPPCDSARARVGYVPERRALPENARVHDALAFFARMRGFSKADALTRAGLWVDKLELGDKRDAKVGTCSNGQQQKVQIALALMCEPELILLDEPLTALDPAHQDVVTTRLREAAAAGATVLLSTHRLREAEALIGHVILVAQGRKVLDQPLHEALSEASEGCWSLRITGSPGWVDGPELAWVEEAAPGDLRLQLRPGATLAPLLARAAAAGGPIRSLQQHVPTLHELYLRKARQAWPEEAS